jgi:glycosyltransferase involved in cell wall biosynthesis
MSLLSLLIPTFNNGNKILSSFNSLEYILLYKVYIRDNASTDNTRSICQSIFGDKLVYNLNSTNVGAIRNHELVIKDLDKGFGCIFGDDDIPNQEYIDNLPSFFSSDLIMSDKNIPAHVSNPYIKAWYASQSIPGMTSNSLTFSKYYPFGYSGIYPQVLFALRCVPTTTISYSDTKPIKVVSDLSFNDRVLNQGRDRSYNFSERLNLLASFIPSTLIISTVLPSYKYEIAYTFLNYSYLDRFRAVFHLLYSLSFKLPYKLQFWFFLYLLIK